MVKSFRSFLLLIFLFQVSVAVSQTDSCGLRISLLTCSPGEELYSTFGHSALRVTDYKAGTDIVYNYGTFDFQDPDFLLKFTRGQLLYFLDQESFQGFLNDYRAENRSVREQLLNLSCSEKMQMQQALFINMRDENRSYKYDFLFDNCTTRLRNLILRNGANSYTTGNVLPNPETTFRDHIHHYLNENKQYWSKLGIDILLGKKMDRDMTNDEAMFLPDYLEKGLDSTFSSTGRLVTAKQVLFERKETDTGTGSIFTPTVVFWLLFLITALISFFTGPKFKKFLSVLDFLAFFITGMLGCLLIFMWVGTDHNTTQNNLNLLWAIPTHAIGAFFTGSKKNRPVWYFRITTAACLLLVIGWFLLPQQLDPALIPWVLIIALRSFFIARGQSFRTSK